MISTQQLLYFVRTVEKGSVNQSAKSLFISQPALTKQLSQLEAYLDCSLLIRKPTGIELTEAGRKFYDRARFILDQIENTEQHMKTYKDQEEIRIGALPSLATYLLPKLMEQTLPESNHRISLAIRDTTHELLHLVMDNTLDVAFVQDFEQRDGIHSLSSIPLFEEAYFAVLHATHGFAGRDSIRFSDFLRERFILHKDPCDIRTSFRRECFKLGQEAQPVLELDFNEPILTFVAQGRGISIVPKMVADHVQETSVQCRPFEDCTFSRTISLVYAADTSKNSIYNWIDRIAARYNLRL